MFKHSKKIITTVFVLLTISVVLVASVPQAKAQFILASWDYPDEYGQGIYKFQVYENSTGSWIEEVANYAYTDSYSIEWEIGVAIKLRCHTSFNSTHTGSATTDIGKLFQRHNVTVLNALSEEVFSQQNFTFTGGFLESYHIYLYTYDVVLNFLPEYGQTYTVSVVYEIYY